MVRWIAVLACALFPWAAFCQHLAAYGGIGYQSGVSSSGYFDFKPVFNRAQVGGYTDLPAGPLLLGVDARYSGGYGINGGLFGPRVAIEALRSGDLQPYVEGLFGNAHAPVPPTEITFGNESSQNPDSRGFCAYFAAGLDYRYAQYADWRAVEVTYGTYAGRPGKNEVTVTTGLVFRWSPTHRQPGRRSYRKR